MGEYVSVKSSRVWYFVRAALGNKGFPFGFCDLVAGWDSFIPSSPYTEGMAL